MDRLLHSLAVLAIGVLTVNSTVKAQSQPQPVSVENPEDPNPAPSSDPLNDPTPEPGPSATPPTAAPNEAAAENPVQPEPAAPATEPSPTQAPTTPRYKPNQAGRLQVPKNPGVRTHDTFFFRVTLGATYATLNASEDLIGTIKGGGSVSSLALGYSVASNIVVFGQLSDLTMINPTIEVNGTDRSTKGFRISGRGIGVGAAYYLPINVHFTGVLSLTQLNPSDDDESSQLDNSELGVVLSGTVGKEFWVSDNWGLGLGVQLNLGSIPSKKDTAGQSFSTGVFSLAIVGTATFD